MQQGSLYDDVFNFSTKIDHFWSSHTFSKNCKLKGKFLHNLGQNILEFFTL